jgi:hypothetical protein
VIVNSSTRHTFEDNGGSSKKYTTALIAISAAGQVLPPFIIYSGQNLMDSWCKNGPTGTHYAVTDKVNIKFCFCYFFTFSFSFSNQGWINSWAFEYWLREMFIPATSHINRPLLLIIDGHAAHVNINVIKLMQEHHIVCLMLPPHSTHALQPIDVVLFNNVKSDWSNIIKNHIKAGNKTIKNSHIPALMTKLFVDKQAFSTTRIVSSFARSGKINEVYQSNCIKILIIKRKLFIHFLL